MNGYWVVAVTPGRASDRVVVELLDEIERWLVAANVARRASTSTAASTG